MKRPLFTQYQREKKRFFPDSVLSAQMDAVIELLKTKRELEFEIELKKEMIKEIVKSLKRWRKWGKDTNLRQ